MKAKVSRWVPVGRFSSTSYPPIHISTSPPYSFQLSHINTFINTACDNLVPGEVLCVAEKGKDCQPVHVVRAGDTCETIALGGRTTRPILIVNNPNINGNCSNLAVGEVVCVAQSAVPQ